ncbi:MAG: Lrp/AsnC family transcriptional regulator [Anaerovorax sp.]|nr:Lrp/AsnC family transcriptional regulator [Anaerovorax sp.]
MKIKNYDQIDEMILNLLIENSRMSYIEIAEKVGLSRISIKNRIEALENAGVIERYTVILNPEKIGRNVSAFFDIQVKPDALYSIIDALSQEESITDMYLMTGSTNLHVHAVLSMNENLESFLLDKIYVLSGIERVKSELIISRLKTRKGIRV